MRDPKRIYVVINNIMHEWEKFPDLRLGQLISNSVTTTNTDLFYLEDEELVKVIQKYVGALDGNKNHTR